MGVLNAIDLGNMNMCVPQRGYRWFTAVTLIFIPGLLPASILNLTLDDVTEVTRIARAISIVQPYLPENKYVEFSVGIRRASKRYGIEPSILISIVQQETSFREDLPEGPAGELGICQILRDWLDNTKFRNEFPGAKEADFSKPAQSFLFAAWILRELRRQTNTHTLPYWSYYNATTFENRLKYYVQVNRYVTLLRRYQLYLSASALHMTQEQIREIVALREKAMNRSTVGSYALLEARRLGSRHPSSRHWNPARHSFNRELLVAELQQRRNRQKTIAPLPGHRPSRVSNEAPLVPVVLGSASPLPDLPYSLFEKLMPE